MTRSSAAGRQSARKTPPCLRPVTRMEEGPGGPKGVRPFGLIRPAYGEIGENRLGIIYKSLIHKESVVAPVVFIRRKSRLEYVPPVGVREGRVSEWLDRRCRFSLPPW